MVAVDRAGEFAVDAHSMDYGQWQGVHRNRSMALGDANEHYMDSDAKSRTHKRHRKHRRAGHHGHPALRYHTKANHHLENVKTNHSTRLRHSITTDVQPPYVSLHWEIPKGIGPTTSQSVEVPGSEAWIALRHDLLLLFVASALLTFLVVVWVSAWKSSKQTQPQPSSQRAQCRNRGRRPVWNKEKPAPPSREGVREWRTTEEALHHAQHTAFLDE